MTDYWFLFPDSWPLFSHISRISRAVLPSSFVLAIRPTLLSNSARLEHPALDIRTIQPNIVLLNDKVKSPRKETKNGAPNLRVLPQANGNGEGGQLLESLESIVEHTLRA